MVVTLKFADVAPAGTVMFEGTVATFVLLLKRLITAPPEGAGALSVTVPVEFNPPLTLAGLRVSARSVGRGIDGTVGVGDAVGIAGAVGVGVGDDFGIDVDVADEAPTHNNALTFELL